jgi:hypothetical protein
MVFARRGRAFQNVCTSLARVIYADNYGCRPESLLRRALFEETGGMYPELITRPDIKVFLPPIGGMTVYICRSTLRRIVIHISLTYVRQLAQPRTCQTKARNSHYVCTTNVGRDPLNEAPANSTCPQATVLTCLALTFARASRTSYSRLRSASVRHSMVGLVSLCTSARRAVPSVK